MQRFMKGTQFTPVLGIHKISHPIEGTFYSIFCSCGINWDFDSLQEAWDRLQLHIIESALDTATQIHQP